MHPDGFEGSVSLSFNGIVTVKSLYYFVHMNINIFIFKSQNDYQMFAGSHFPLIVK